MEKYKKIKHLGDSENKDIFKVPDDEIVVTEKVDGSNMRVWSDNGRLVFGSRNVDDLERDNKQFKKIMDYIENILSQSDEWLDEDLIYVGEAMKKHSLEYDWTDIPKFIGFDVLHKDTGKPLGWQMARKEFKRLGFKFINIICRGKTKEIKDKDLDRLMKESKYRDGKPEGIVIKNYRRENQYGRPLFAKVVTEKFKEKKDAKFGKQKVKSDNSKYIVEKYATEARIRKIINKMVVDEGEKLQRELMENLIHRVIHDIFEENIIEMIHDNRINQIDFDVIYKLVPKKCLSVLDDMIAAQIEEE